MASGLGIDLGSNAVKVVRLRKRGATWQALSVLRVEDPAPSPRAGAKPSDPLPQRTLSGDFRARLATAGLSGSGALGITGRDLMVKYVSSPPVPPWKLRLMMDLEIKGTSGAEVCGDYVQLNIPGDLTKELVSLVAVAKTGYVESHMGLAKGAGLGTEWCCPNAVALFNAFTASAQFRPGETTAVLDIGRDNLELVIQRDGVLYFARSAPGGGRRFTDVIDGVFNLGYERAEQYKCVRAEIHTGDAGGLEASQLKVSGALREVADGMAAALRSATMFCKSQAKISKLEVERLVLSGGGAQLRGLAEYLKDRLKLPVDLLDPASRLDISRLPRDQQALLEGPGAGGMSVAIGLAMAAADESAMRVAILPDKTIKTRRFWRGTVWAIGAGVALLGVLGFDYGWASKHRDAASVRKEAVDKALGEMQRLAKQVDDEGKVNREMKARTELIEGPAQRNTPVLGFLKLLRDATPEGITLERISAGPAGQGDSGASEVAVTVSGRIEVARFSNIFDALNAYLQDLGRERPGQVFKVTHVKPTTEMAEGDRSPSDGRKPFTFEARLATLGVAVEEGSVLDAPIPEATETSIIPRASGFAPQRGGPGLDPGVGGEPGIGPAPTGGGDIPEGGDGR